MTLRSVIKLSQRFIIDNSPTILSGVAVTGTLMTAYLTGKATFRAAEIIEQEAHYRGLQELGEPLNNKDKAKLTWKCYIPTALVVVGTVGCIVGANHINAKRMAALAAAYKLSEKQISEYKDKVKEIIGEKQEGEVRTAVSQDIVTNNPPGQYIFQAHGGETLCLDKWTGRYFRSDMQTIRAAENDLSKVLYRGSERAVAVADFYDAIGLSAPDCSQEVGWNADTGIEFGYDTVMSPDGVPCLVVDFRIEPFPIRAFLGRP